MKQIYRHQQQNTNQVRAGRRSRCAAGSPGPVFGGGLLPKAGVLALLLGIPSGPSVLSAGADPHQPQYRFIAIAVPVPSEALGINDNGLVTGAYVDPATGGWTSFVLNRGHLTTGIEISRRHRHGPRPRQHLGRGERELWQRDQSATRVP